MNKDKIQKMYSDLGKWVEAGIGDDIITLAGQRQEYQPYVVRARSEGKKDEEIPQAVLWMLREEYNTLSKVEMTQPVTLSKGKPEKDKNNRFVKGNVGGGRPKGALNKSTLEKQIQMNVLDTLKSMDFSPLKKLISLYESTKDTSLKYDILQKLLEYCYPKLKEVEQTNPESNDDDLSDGEIIDVLSE